MSDDIAEAKRVSFDIIDRKRGTQQEPSVYILVPFNDPGTTFRPSSSTARRIRVEICGFPKQLSQNDQSQDDCVSLNASCFITHAGFGPLIVTTNPDVFKGKINTLSASGGGDIPELSLSGLQVSTFFFFLTVYSDMLTL